MTVRFTGLRRRLLAAFSGLFLGACSCATDEPVFPPDPLVLLARKPDSRIEQPGAIVPRGDLPGTVHWGPYEGPGWSKTALTLPDGTAYRETNQATASILLAATRPCDRELVLRLWCPRPCGGEPAPMTVRVNGVAVLENLIPSREPAEVRIPVPEPLWGAGENQLALDTPVQILQTRLDDMPPTPGDRPVSEREGKRCWDILAVASVSYGLEALVQLDLSARSARLPDGAGMRYKVELASDAEVRLAGRSPGAGTLRVHTWAMEPARGLRSGESVAAGEFAVRAGSLEGAFFLHRQEGLVRVLELEWFSPEGSELVLERLDVVERRPRPRPPIVLVSIDTFAARHLSLHGYARGTSPVLEALAEEAVVFERCHANAPWTLPSYLSLMSGIYPRSHLVSLSVQEGARLDNWDWWQLARNRWTLAEVLRARGYRTAGFVDTYWLSPQYGFEQGFDTYDGQAALAPFSDVRAGIQMIVEKLVPEWLAAGSQDVPPFLFLHALDAHGPFWPEAPYRDAFSGDLPEERTAVPAGSTNQTYRTMPTWMARTLVPDEQDPVPPELPLEDVVARYDEAILKVDAYLGKLFELLRARGLYDQALIVVTADHGEAFGPGVYGHGIMREDVLHVPLILKLPHAVHGGRRVATDVQLVDLYPTLLEVSGADPLAPHLHGESLLRRLEESTTGERQQYSEGGHVEQYAYTLGRWKLLDVRPGSESSEASLLTHPRVPEGWLRENFPELLERPLSDTLRDEILTRPGARERIAALREVIGKPYYELYDREADPGDLHDLAAAHPEIVERLKPLLERERERGRRARGNAIPDGFRHELPPDALAELKALGYAGDQ